MSIIGTFFNLFLIDPLTNLFVLLATLTGSAGAAVILLTLTIRLATFPLQRKQMHTTRVMSALQPRMTEIQKRYKDPKRRSEEQMKLYKEAGVNPLGCFGSLLLQMPILIALYRVFSYALGSAPEAVIRLQERLYGWSYLRSELPFPTNFLWLDLGKPDPLLLPILVAATTYVLQKMSALPTMDEKQRAQASMMNLMMPLLFGWITISLPSGLGLYYVLSNAIGIGMQYLYVGGGPVNWRALVGLSDQPVLPKAADMRQRQIDAASDYGRSPGDRDEEADGDGNGAKPAPKEPQPAAGKSRDRNRRRYASGGKRRGRR